MDKKVNLSLVGLDGNVFYLMGVFQRQARKEGWTDTEIKEVLDEARSSDYNHFVAVLDDHCETKDNEEDNRDYSECGP